MLILIATMSLEQPPKPPQPEDARESFEAKPYQATIYAVDSTETVRSVVSPDRLRAPNDIPIETPTTSTRYWCNFIDTTKQVGNRGNGLKNDKVKPRPSRYSQDKLAALTNRLAQDFVERGGDMKTFGIRFATPELVKTDDIAHTGDHTARPLTKAERDRFVELFQETQNKLQAA